METQGGCFAANDNSTPHISLHSYPIYDRDNTTPTKLKEYLCGHLTASGEEGEVFGAIFKKIVRCWQKHGVHEVIIQYGKVNLGKHQGIFFFCLIY